VSSEKKERSGEIIRAEDFTRAKEDIETNGR